MSKRLVALSLCSAVLIGCGSGSDSSSHELKEYSLADYQDRVVSSATPTGTWVAVGSGLQESTGFQGGLVKNHFAVKEYFIITENEGGYRKADCELGGFEQVSITDNQITIGSFSGTITDNQLMSGQDLVEQSFEEYESTRTTSLAVIKISDATANFGSVIINDSGEETVDGVSCYQQLNGYIDYKNFDESYSRINAGYTSFNDTRGDFAYKSIDTYYYNFDTDDAGHSVEFDVSVDSNFSESISFSASDGVDSVTGTLTVQLPLQ
ncbi:MAG: hypothetical protein HWE18_14480 [Gammaproteobacteria bacterium]|nr:hypothetical protein [Gammaproteobacteria bacterium]